MKKLLLFSLFISVFFSPLHAQPDTKLLGMTEYGGNTYAGVIYSLDGNGSNYAVETSFLRPSAARPNNSKLLYASNGKLYGVSTKGNYADPFGNGEGNIYEYDPVTEEYNNIYDFQLSSNGITPEGNLIETSPGKLYGVTRSGGANTAGVLYEYDLTANTYNIKHNFNSSSGAGEKAGLTIGSNGNIYGCTAFGGSNNSGVLFEYNPTTSAFTVLVNFNGTTDGSEPITRLIEVGSNIFFGTTRAGGANGDGVLFKYDANTSTYSVLTNFTSTTTGSTPTGELTVESNSLYGMAASGGANNYGTLFKWDLSLGILTPEYDFTANTGYANGNLVVSNGSLYGFTRSGGQNGVGIMFSFNISSSAFSTLVNLTTKLGVNYNGTPVIVNNKIYTVSETGGNGMYGPQGFSTAGVISEYNLQVPIFKVVVDFQSCPNGCYPEGNLTAVGNKVYGLTTKGGDNKLGTLFEYDLLSKQMLPLLSFNSTNGKNPNGNLENVDGVLYGISSQGGLNNEGVLFAYDTKGKVLLYTINFSNSTVGANPYRNLISDGQGNLYGYTFSGGANGSGCLFRINTQNKKLSKLIDFGPSITISGAGLVYSNSGTLMWYNSSQVCELDPQNLNFTVLATGSIYSLGSEPIQATNNNLYWLGQAWQNSNTSVLYEYNSTSQSINQINIFSGTLSLSGGQLRTKLLQANNSKLYGSLNRTNINTPGAVFEYTLGNASAVKLADFTSDNGIWPAYSGMIEFSETAVINISGNDEIILSSSEPSTSNGTNFGKATALASTIDQTFTITNDGLIDLSLTGPNPVSLNGSSDFTVFSQPSSLILVPGASTTFTIRFTPSSFNTQSATVSIASNDPLKPSFIFDITGSTNTALSFDGNNDKVSTPYNTEFDFGSAFTLEAWIYPQKNTYSRIITNYSGNGTNPGEFVFDTYNPIFPNGRGLRLYMAFGGTNYFATAANVLALSSWNHVAAVYSSGTIELFVDGNSVATATTGSFTSKPTSTNGIAIGEDWTQGTAQEYFQGRMDEVRIWNRALCDDELQSRINSCLQGNENGLVLYYDFEDGTPGSNITQSKVQDKAGLNIGTLNNFGSPSATAWSNGPELSGAGTFTGATITWNGSTSNDWNTVTNWTPNVLPTQCTDVVIPVTPNNPNFANNQSVNSIEIQTGASLTIQPGGCFWVGSSFTNNGSFVLQANATNYAQYQGPQVAGTLQQVISERGWHTISSPFVDATIGDIQFDQGAFIEHGGGATTCNTCNLWYYDPSSWQQLPPGWNGAWGTWKTTSSDSDPFDGDQVYNLFLAEGYFLPGTFPVTITVSGTLRGTPNTQELNQANGGWNHLANPFPSVIDWEKWHDNSGLNNTYYVWSAADNNYATYQAGGTSTFGATRYIAPFQGVFTRTSVWGDGTTGSTPNVFQDHITSNADRPTSCPSLINEFYKTQSTENAELRLTMTSNGGRDELVIKMNDIYSEAFNAQEDAAKFFSSDISIPSMYAIIENNPCVIAGYPTPDIVVNEIPLGHQTKKGHEIRIEAQIPAGVTAILEDKVMNRFHNLITPYNYSTQSEVDNARFKLHVGDEFLRADEMNGSDDYIAYVDNGMLQFVSNPQFVGGHARLIDATGRIVSSQTVEYGSGIIVNQFTIGLYVLVVENEGRIYTQKLIVK